MSEGPMDPDPQPPPLPPQWTPENYAQLPPELVNRGSLMKGLGIGCGLLFVGPALMSGLAFGIGLGWDNPLASVLFSVAGLVPYIAFIVLAVQFHKRQPETFKGMLLFIGLCVLLVAACFGLVLVISMGSH